MKKKIITLAALLVGITGVANAGMVATTANSRANCYNNESVTWFFNHPYDWRVFSVHYNIYHEGTHQIDTGYRYTWRQAAIHWGEAPLGDHRWTVSGYHFLADYGNGNIPFDKTYAHDCSIYNGWWDH